MDEFYKILLKYRHNPFLFIEPDCPNSNNGDHLIYLGIEKALKDLNIAFEKVGFINNGGMPATQRPFYLLIPIIRAKEFLSTAYAHMYALSLKELKSLSLIIAKSLKLENARFGG